MDMSKVSRHRHGWEGHGNTADEFSRNNDFQPSPSTGIACTSTKQLLTMLWSQTEDKIFQADNEKFHLNMATDVFRIFCML